jgi:hypothetical protein
MKDENGDLLAYSHNILSRWKNNVSQLLNVPRVSDVRQIEIHTAEALVPDPSCFDVEIAIAELIIRLNSCQVKFLLVAIANILHIVT